MKLVIIFIYQIVEKVKDFQKFRRIIFMSSCAIPLLVLRQKHSSNAMNNVDDSIDTELDERKTCVSESHVLKYIIRENVIKCVNLCLPLVLFDMVCYYFIKNINHSVLCVYIDFLSLSMLSLYTHMAPLYYHNASKWNWQQIYRLSHFLWFESNVSHIDITRAYINETIWNCVNYNVVQCTYMNWWE